MTTLTDQAIDQVLDACERAEDTTATPAPEEPTGSSGAPVIPPAFPGLHWETPDAVGDAAFLARMVLRRCAALRGAATC